MNAIIKKCTINDFDTLRDLSIKTFYETYVLFNTAENMDKYIRDAFETDKFKNEFMCPDSSFYLLYNDDVLCGYIKLNEALAQTDIKDENSLEIERIYVLADFQGTGLGKYLIDQAVKIAKEKKKKYLWLGVWEENEKAINFYKRNGFYIFGTHNFLVGNDLQKDHIMRKDL